MPVRKTAGKSAQNEIQPLKKHRKSKIMNKKKNSLLAFLGSFDLSVLKVTACDKLNKQFTG